jgi:hypothetical protein
MTSVAIIGSLAQALAPSRRAQVKREVVSPVEQQISTTGTVASSIALAKFRVFFRFV